VACYFESLLDNVTETLLIQATSFKVSMQDTKVTISYLTTILRIPGNVCELDVFFIIQTLASLDLQNVVLTVIRICQYHKRYLQTCIQTHKQQTHSGMLLLQ